MDIKRKKKPLVTSLALESGMDTLIFFSFLSVRLKNHVEAESYVYFLTSDKFQEKKNSKQNKQNALCVGTC